MNDRDSQLFDVYRINLRTAERTLEVRNDMGAIGFLADHGLHVRCAIVPRPDGGMTLLARQPGSDDWKPACTWSQEDALTTNPICLAADDRRIYWESSVGTDTAELRIRDIETGEETVLATKVGADIARVLVHPTTHEIQAVAFTEERDVWEVLDPTIEPHFQALAELHAGDFQVVGRDDADTIWLVEHVQDDGSPVYHAYEVETRSAQFLFTTRPDLDHVALSPMRPISFTARDGLTIHGYLTLPPDADADVEAKGLPLVLNVHGGPWVRDRWGYASEAQWLANRGYACLQLNYRGSTGYGKDFCNAGDKEWGGKMQDDLTDGVQWAIGEGIADPRRIAIYGGSYGGFACLSGLTSTPDLYACGVDIVGPSSLITFIETIPPYWQPMIELFRRRVGDPDVDREMLIARSPLHNVEKIRAPLLIAQGANDPRVKRSESIQIRDSLERAGKIVEYMEFADEGHGFARPENRFIFYAAAERFLATHLGGRCEPAADDERMPAAEEAPPA